MPFPRPCLTCGIPTLNGSWCTNCAPANERSRRPSSDVRYGPGWRAISKAVIKRDGGICQLQLRGCSFKATTADHIIARSAGGDNSMENLRAACRPCNSRRGAARR